MSAPPHPASEDRTFRASLLRHAAAAVVLVMVVAGTFWAIGSVGAEEQQAAVEAPQTEPAPEDVPGPPPEEVEDPVDPESLEDPEPEDEEPDPPDEPDEPEPADEADDDADEDAGDEGAEDDEPADDADEPEADADEAETEDEDTTPADEPAPPAIDRASISVQVLDGYQADGGTAARALADEISELGYNVVARNPALRYDVTTVLWSPGFEAEGRQVARDIGAGDARQQPGNLSTSVAVHVVVGADRG